MQPVWKKILCAATAIWVLGACEVNIGVSDSASASEPVSSKPVSKLPANAPEYLVATEAGYPPFEFRDENGQIVGYDVDLLTAIGEDQGFKVRFIHHNWEGIFNNLDNGSRSIVAAGVVVNEERQQKYAFSEPYAQETNLAVYLDKDLNINSLDDLKNLSVATQAETTQAETLAALKGGAQHLVTTPTLYLALKKMVAGEVQAVVGDGAVLRYYLRGEPGIDFKVWEWKEEGGAPPIAFVFKKDNEALRAQVNQGLQNIKRNGVYERITRQWLGDSALVPDAASAASATP